MNDALLNRRIEAVRDLGNHICTQLREEIDKLGFEPNPIRGYPEFHNARYRTVTDPYSGAMDITGDWFNARGERIGNIQFHADGTFYAEFDVSMAHPRDTRWFVEAVTAWGRDGVIKSEPKLLPALS